MIQETTEFTHSLLTRRRIAAVEDVIEHIAGHYADRGTIGVFFRQPRAIQAHRDGDTPGRYLYFNQISFIAGPDGIVRFSHPNDAISAMAEMKKGIESRTLKIHEFDNLALIWCTDFRDDEVAAFGTLLISFYSASDVDANQIETATRLLVRQDRRGPAGLRDIVHAVADRFSIRAAYYIASPREAADGLEARAEFDLIARTDDPELRQLLALDRLQADARGSLDRGLSYSGRVLHHDWNYYYKVVPVSFLDLLGDEDILFDPRATIVTKQRLSPPRRRVGAIILLDRKPIEALCFSYATVLVDEFIGAVSHAVKISTLQRLAETRARAQLQLLQSPFNGAADQRARIVDFAQAVCSALVQVTPAHSATVRLYDPFSQTLEPVGAAFCATLTPSSARARLIPADARGSLNGFVFHNMKAGEYAYIKDVQDELPTSYRSRGLSEVLLFRPETKSEVCLPIYKTGLQIGVLNIEAGDDHAFDRDLKFIDGLARQLGDFVDIITRSSDAGWLPRLSFIHFAAHRLEELKRALVDHPHVLKAVSGAQQKMSVDYIDPADRAKQATTALLEKIQEFTKQVLADDKKVWQEILKIAGNIPETISQRQAHSLEVILENLIENASAHDSMRWVMNLSFGLGPDGAPRLTIDYSPPDAWLLPEDTDRFGIAPRWDAADSTYRLGMFLAGVHVRLLGGVMWVDQAKSEANGSVAFRYVIQIPLDPDPRQHLLVDQDL